MSDTVKAISTNGIHHLAQGWLLLFSYDCALTPGEAAGGYNAYLTEPCDTAEHGKCVTFGTGRNRSEAIVDLWLALAAEDALLPGDVVEALQVHVDVASAAIAHRLKVAPIDPTKEACV
jgi:hypothetical protein